VANKYKLAKFHGNVHSLSEKLRKLLWGYFFDSHCMFVIVISDTSWVIVRIYIFQLLCVF